MKFSDILGLNARNYEYTTRYNTAKGKHVANSKLLTKSVLRKARLATPRMFTVIREEEDLDRFDFAKLTDDFVVKPNRGLGGEGIIVVEARGDEPGTWITTQGKTITIEDLKLHVGDILEGRFSMNNLPDIAYIEERVLIHPVFEPYTFHGTPDIGVLIFNRVPVMAFLRLPTEESGGRANMHQGAIACGIDIATGVTTNAVRYSEPVAYFPGTNHKLRGIQIPEWDRVMELAIKAAEAAGLGYMRADIVLQPSKKTPEKTIPKILELNAQPGLKIQLANKAGLRRRLERIEGLEVDSPEHGIRIAKHIFGDVSMKHLGKKVTSVGVFEEVEVEDAEGKLVTVKAKIDTGAYRTSIDEKLARELGILTEDKILYTKEYQSALGESVRPVIEICFVLGGKRIETTASVTDRSALKRPMLIGRRDLKGFLVDFSRDVIA